jgi:GT2 family glycosyltransferase
MGRRRAGRPPSVDLILRESLKLACWYAAARIAGWLRPPAIGRSLAPTAGPAAPAGISVVIPSRNGLSLLAAQLPGIVRELTMPAEVIVVDNGSSDGTAAWLAAEWPRVEVEVSAEPLSFAAAVNRGIARARYSHVCLLNNDMLLEPGFFRALRDTFDRVPGLFCATAQIRFPAGVRREETGKAVMAQSHPDDFPIRCDEPVAGEDLTWVLYGSGGCSLYDAALLRALGGIDEAYAPAYVEDLDVGYRAWQRGWPTVFVAGAVVEHRHRATTSRYYTEAELAAVLETNYLKFLARTVARRPLFRKLWKQAIGRLRRRGDRTLRLAAGLALAGGRREAGTYPEERVLALTSGDVAAFPGGDPSAAPLVTFAERLEPPTAAVLARHCEVVLVRGGNDLALRTAIEWTEKKWRARDKWAGKVPLREPRLPGET